MNTDRRDSVFAAGADAGDDVRGVFADGVARGRRTLGEAIGDRVAMIADGRSGLFAASADAGDHVVRVFGGGAARSR